MESLHEAILSEPGIEKLGKHEETLLASANKEGGGSIAIGLVGHIQPKSSTKVQNLKLAKDEIESSLCEEKEKREKKFTTVPDKTDNVFYVSLAQEEEEGKVVASKGDTANDAALDQAGADASQKKMIEDKCGNKSAKEKCDGKKKRGNKGGYGKFVCEQCERAFYRKTNLDKHTQLKHRTEISSPFPEENGKIYFPCNQCQDTFSCKRNLVRHMAKKHKSKDNEQRFICDICSKTFKRQGRLDRHLQFYHSIEKDKSLEDETKLCDVCSKYFATSKNLMTHKRNIHGSKNQVICHDCGKYFK